MLTNAGTEIQRDLLHCVVVFSQMKQCPTSLKAAQDWPRILVYLVIYDSGYVILVYLVIYDSGYVSLEHLLLSWYPSQSITGGNPMPRTDPVPHQNHPRLCPQPSKRTGPAPRIIQRAIDSGLVRSMDFHSQGVP
jgi:hypothetical protein